MEAKHLNSFDTLRAYADSVGVALETSDVSALATPLLIEGKTAPNRLLIQPMEGGDAEEDGAPSASGIRRYLRYASGGAGIIWMEATAILHELKSHPRQLVLSGRTLDQFSRLIAQMRDTARKSHGADPLIILQMTHPGRSCYPLPRPASDRALWDSVKPSNGVKSATDDEIKGFAEVYANVAALAKRAGFDGVEVKACHFYFISELLSAYERPGVYGGGYENRTRHLRESFAAVRAAAPELILTIRLNAYDGLPYPYGFGMKEGGGFAPDLSEPIRLISEIKDDYGVELVNISSSGPNGSLFPDAQRLSPLFAPSSDSLIQGARMHYLAAHIKAAVPDAKIVATGFAHFRQYAPGIGSAMINNDQADLIGFGRQSFAYPDFAKDILTTGVMDESTLCLCCGGCGRLLGGKAKPIHCVVRDREYYNTL